MAKGGVVMDVTNAEQARIAEKAGVNIHEPEKILNHIYSSHI